MTAADIRQQIDLILEQRRLAAERSEYDWKVCVLAVGAARSVATAVPVNGAPAEYRAKVLAALRALMERYDDPDGEYTSGKSDIGTVIAMIERLPAA